MSSQSLATPVTTPARRAGNIALWTLQILLAAAFIYGGLNKLCGFQQDQEITTNFAKFGFGSWFRYFVGALELLGGLGLLIPRFAGLAALGLAGVMAGAVLAHLTVLPPWQVAFAPGILCLLFGLVAWQRWPRTKALLGRR